jgi:hypothetical protein
MCIQIRKGGLLRQYGNFALSRELRQRLLYCLYGPVHHIKRHTTHVVRSVVPVFRLFGIVAHFVPRIVVLDLIIIVQEVFRGWFIIPSGRVLSACRRVDFIVE